MIITQLIKGLNKYAAHSILGNTAEKRSYANLVWKLWKQASGISEQLKQNLSEDNIIKNVRKMHNVAEDVVTKGAPLIHPKLIQPKTAGFMSLAELNHNIGVALIADATAKTLEPKYHIAKTAQEINAEFGALLLMEKMGLEVHV